jgi:glycosyltransferase involved in cell wall biosynthesis
LADSTGLDSANLTHFARDEAERISDSPMHEAPTMSVSVVVPIYNEVENIRRLHAAITAGVKPLQRHCEIILVDDGSTDGSRKLLAELADEDPRLRVIEFRHNFGQTAAMHAGIQAATGDVIVTMDGDLQNDPADIPMIVAKLDEGYDLVQGWRKDRKDPFFSRRLPSHCANWLISRVTGFPVHDLGCSLKAIRRDVAQELRLYGEMHRFIPILAHWRGAKCAEVVTRHRPREFGQSKYGISRTLRVLFDLITVKYLTRYLISPMKLFGSVGLVCGVVGLVAGAATIGMKLMQGADMTGNPLLLLAAVSTMLALQFLGMGMLGELGVRIFYEFEQNQPYAIRRTRNFPSPSPRVAGHEPSRRAA